jgi:hypothetical protein
MRFLWVVFLTFIVTAAQASSCIKALPENPVGHWHYRYVDGEKCWFGPSGHAATSQDRGDTASKHRDISRRSPANTPAEESPSKAPVPIEAIAEAPLQSEPVSPLPFAPEPTRVKTLTVKPPLTARQRIEEVFDALVKRCEKDLNACTGLDQ